MDPFVASCEAVVEIVKQQQACPATDAAQEAWLEMLQQVVDTLVVRVLCFSSQDVVSRAVVPLLREQYLRGVVTSKALHESASARALRTVDTAMSLAAALCVKFGAGWTVDAAPETPPEQRESFAVLLVALCTTVVRTQAAAALSADATMGSPAVRAVSSCAAMLCAAIEFLTSDDDGDDGDESAWWAVLRPQALLGMRQRIVETLVDVSEALAEASKPLFGTSKQIFVHTLTQPLAEWILVDVPTEGAQQCVLDAALAAFGGADKLIEYFERACFEQYFTEARFEELRSRILARAASD